MVNFDDGVYIPEKLPCTFCSSDKYENEIIYYSISTKPCCSDKCRKLKNLEETKNLEELITKKNLLEII